MTEIAAGLAGATAILFALVMVFHRSLYVCAVSLLVVILQTGVMFLLMGSPLLGLLQVMIYAGAVMVLTVITVMAAGPDEGPRFSQFAFPRPLAVAGLVAAALQLAVLAGPVGLPAQPVPADLGAQLGTILFKRYALATEAVTLLMFLASLAIAPRPEELP